MQARGQKDRLDLSTVEVRKFSSASVVNRFDCGKRPIDIFLKNKAKRYTKRYECTVYCAHIGSSPTVLGFYSLCVGSDSVSDMMREKQNYVKHRVSFPSLHIPFLGVTTEYQRQGLGSFLLMDAFQKVRLVAEYAGLYALTLQSMDAESTAFYKSLDFEPYTEDDEQPKMLYPIDNIFRLVDGNPIDE
ncbi:GNAT superfamily N-acetyltransferase [Ochrobactrum sp. 19YEA23]|uniref:GNAT family N-acetyltransferase n=1 Tax=Ochrobactrum sp. 19YEA23 TaxID=3039854 RepID=UPI00247A4444|nr:GNAT superfamily N-acetyltransferase [Ochrobactrum sp. 19YEA23]